MSAETHALLAHEAAHVVDGLLVGRHVREVRLGATTRQPNNSGTTTFALDGGVDLYGRLVSTLMGPMAEGQAAAGVAAAARPVRPQRRAHRRHAGRTPEVGAVDPATMREIRGQGLHVAGRLVLQDSEVAVRRGAR